jgi:AmiR/NasT family two-component response regulator
MEKSKGPARVGGTQEAAYIPGEAPRLLRELRSLRVLLVHPDDEDGRDLRDQLQRIGCDVRVSWPPAQTPAEAADVVFLAMRPETLSSELPWLKRDGAPPVIAVVNCEDPATIAAVLRLNAHGAIAPPVKPVGLLCALVLARNQVERARDKDKYVARLEQRLAAQRKIARAKAILMQTRSISEDDAYKLIRERAMSRRVTTEQIAEAVISANEILGTPAKG